jgi:hypothetical protein
MTDVKGKLNIKNQNAKIRKRLRQDETKLRERKIEIASLLSQ